MRFDQQKQQWRGRKRGWKRQEYALLTALLILMTFGIVTLIKSVQDQNLQEETKRTLSVSSATDVSDEVSKEPGKETEILNQQGLETTTEPLRKNVADTQSLLNEENERAEWMTGLKALNPDIVGWLSIPGRLEEAIVQRDNEFYMNHDALGNENINGAVFLDSLAKLKANTQTLLLYGHNMRSGEMFGSLWQYEDDQYFNENQRIRFKCEFGNWEYETFAAGRIGVTDNKPNYLNILDLYSSDKDIRERTISILSENSEVVGRSAGADDNLLILITCVDDDGERRYVAAKKIK